MIENLDDLEKLVTRLFRNVKNKEAMKFRFSLKHHPYGPKQLGFKMFVVPIEDETTQMMSLTFPVNDYSDKYRTDVSQFICRLNLRIFKDDRSSFLL